MGSLDKPVLVICGPTGSGKTKIGIDVARRIGGEIISADARQFYKLMDIGTAKPTPEERAQVPHHLVDIANINDHITAADFRDLALKCIAGIFCRGCIPIIVGGSGLYIRALEKGFFEGPKADPQYRRYLESRIEKEGIESLYKYIQEIDRATADRLSPRDRSRIIRALEVHNSTGKSMTTLWNESQRRQSEYEFIKAGIRWLRAELHKRIDARVKQMVEAGFIDEVKIVQENIHPDSIHLFKSLGYREFKGYLDGNYDLDRAIYLTQLRTHQYAKRQMTWFNADPDIRWFDPQENDVVENIISYFRTMMQSNRLT